MTPEELEAWVAQNPILIALLAALIGCSLIAFIILGQAVLRNTLSIRYPIPDWKLGGTEFALFLIILVVWFILAGPIIFQVHAWINGPQSEPGTGSIIIGGFVVQAGMFFIFQRFRQKNRDPREGPISPKLLSLNRSIGLGLFAFLASLPIVYGVGVVWNQVLEMLRNNGFEIDLPLQDAVVLFKETDNPLAFIALLLLAVVVAPIVEESVFRAGIFRFLKGKVPLAIALLISGSIFGVIHGNLQSLPGLITVGICLGLTYEISGNIRVPIFFHAFFNLNSIIWILLLPDTLPA